MILAPSWLAPGERADGEHLLTLRAEGAATDADEAAMIAAHGFERTLRILSTLTTERQTLARWVHPAGTEIVGHRTALPAATRVDDRTPGAGEPTTPATLRRSLPPQRVSDAPRRARTATAVPGAPRRHTSPSAWRERWQIAAVCAIAAVLMIQLARGGWT